MQIKTFKKEFCVCQVENYSQVDFDAEFCFACKTDEEKSLVCTADKIPGNTIKCDRGWNAFRIEGVLDFSLIGILSKISAVLAENKIGIFAVSTYNTDYILVKSESFKDALKALSDAGYEILD